MHRIIPVILSRSGGLSSRQQYTACCRRWAVSASLIVLLLIVTVAAVAAEAGGPKIVLPEPKFDFGAVPAGHRVEHVFEVRNGGDAVLEIQKVQPT